MSIAVSTFSIVMIIILNCACYIGPPLPEQPPPVPPRRQSLLRSSTLIKEKPHPPLPQELPKQLPPTAPPQDPSSLEQPQNPSPLEYITLREMLAAIVDLLAGNAPVITQLNNHLFSSGLIPNAVYTLMLRILSFLLLRELIR